MTEQVELFVREEGSEEFERNPVPDEFRGASVDIFDFDEREIFVPFFRWPYLAGDRVPGLECIRLYLALRNIDVIWRIEIVVVG